MKKNCCWVYCKQLILGDSQSHKRYSQSRIRLVKNQTTSINKSNLAVESYFTPLKPEVDKPDIELV